jgi:hypothetical protein
MTTWMEEQNKFAILIPCSNPRKVRKWRFCVYIVWVYLLYPHLYEKMSTIITRQFGYCFAIYHLCLYRRTPHEKDPG